MVQSLQNLVRMFVKVYIDLACVNILKHTESQDPQVSISILIWNLTI